MYRVITTREFAKCLRSLRKKGKKGKDAELKARAAQSEAAQDGEISILTRTRHGESRLPNVEKYDLGDGYRLVIQVVNPAERQRAFLFVGDHDDAERWLDNHTSYQWVKRDSDGTLEFVQVSDPRQPVAITPSVDVETPELLLDLPLLRDVTDREWKSTSFARELVHYLSAVTANQWEQDPNGVLAHIESIADTDAALFALDVLEHAHKTEWDQVHRRFELAAGSCAIVHGSDASDAMAASVNSEQFITWEDLDQLPDHSDWADWMLFLHPEQKEFANRDFNGPARLRGVSGSGKTCVMVHRARQLAKKYREDVLLVTLTESMRRLLDVLVRALCGAEAAHIRTSTMNSIATDAVEALGKGGLTSFTMPQRNQLQGIMDEALAAVQAHSAFSATALSKLSEEQLRRFLEDEFAFVRMRFLPAEYDKYLSIARHGRGLPLGEKARTVCLKGVTTWDDALRSRYWKDHDGIVQTALELLSESALAARRTFQYRCVLVDEVQDLSQLEVRILSLIPDASGKRVVNLADGLFLVGDGAQTVYRKGFVLKSCGIEIANRSFVLKKNYRNTKEILEAAYGLISSYEFADVDEESVQTPTQPDLSARHGERPFIVKCQSAADECEYVASTIESMIEEQRAKDEADDLQEPTEVPICVIGFSRSDRQRIQRALERRRIRWSELRDDVNWDSGTVKVSTVESAKGHEFHAVFIVGMQAGSIPSWRVDPSEWNREAARLYVAMTRARDRLFLSYHVAERTGPSVFLSAIQPNCQEYGFKSGELREVE